MTSAEQAAEVANEHRQAIDLLTLAESLLRNAFLPPPGTEVFLRASRQFFDQRAQRVQRRFAEKELA
jgi:hypothetical protein